MILKAVFNSFGLSKFEWKRTGLEEIQVSLGLVLFSWSQQLNTVIDRLTYSATVNVTPGISWAPDFLGFLI